MPVSEDKALFTTFQKFGHWSEADKNETTFAKIRNSGAVFIPYTAWRPSGQSLLKEWGRHGNYSTVSRNGKYMIHVRFTPLAIGVKFQDSSDSDQGCATRLVQNY